MIVVDTSRQHTFTVYFDILFFNLKCSEIVIDVIDEEAGKPLETKNHKITKYRVNPKGDALDDTKEGLKTTTLDTCLSCDVGKIKSTKGEKCCNCVDVKAYYRRNSKLADRSSTHPLCISERLKDTSLSSDGEGCRVAGSLTAPRVKGNFHIAAGSKFHEGGAAHSHHISRGDIRSIKDNFRIQHVIFELRFGDTFPGQSNALNGKDLYNDGLLRHTYFIQLIPTRYEGGWIAKESYQYTYYAQTESIDVASDHWHLPGLFFRYDFTPMKAILSKSSTRLSTYLARLCALIGGTWVVLGLIGRVASKIPMVKKKE